MTTELSRKVRAWLDRFDQNPASIHVYQNGREWVPIGNELPLCFVALVEANCLRVPLYTDLPNAQDQGAP